ncbi:hypothetical protein Tcan_13718 [Toxocara canis]|uniref:DUF7930 domain-containing protein n=1 Tax=Toxocara canis TaxID=6265 RepID=A0A0B2UXY6_TOXCA|nr:hypothetical protein Tcan_13718 [Toxocara canis]
MSKANRISSTGRVTHVRMDCAYLTSDKFGKVLVMPGAVFPSDYGQSDLRQRLKVDDTVHFVAIARPQEQCEWLAVRVDISTSAGIRHSSLSPSLPRKEMQTSAVSSVRRRSFDNSTYRKEVVTVTLVTDTFAYAVSESISTVFIPVTAFLSSDHAKLSDHVASGDCLFVLVRPLLERSGCQWIAISANKVASDNVPSPDSVRSSSQCSCTPTSVELPHDRKGYAVIYFVSKQIAYAHDICGEVVTCPILTWIGGNNGNMDAEGLNEVVAVGETVYFEASCTKRGWRAQRWSRNEPIGGSSDSYTQTAMTSEQMILRAIGPELSDFLRQRIPNVLAYTAL